MWAFWLVTLVVALLVSAIVVVCMRHERRLGLVVFVTSLAALGAIWIVGFSLITAGWNDVDGFVDCYGYCNAWHVVGALLFGGPPLVAVVLTLAAVLGLVIRARGSSA